MNSVTTFSVILLLCTTSYADRRYVSLEEDANRMSYFLIEGPDGTVVVEDLTDTSLEIEVSTSDVVFYFCSRSNPNGTMVTSFSNLPKGSFDPSKEVLVAIHGWRNDHTSPFNDLIHSAVLDSNDLNFIIVDWSSISKQNYIVARNALPEIGKIVTQFLDELLSNYKISLSNVSIVGHSLGAHVSGIVGASLGGQVRFIVGLDPAGPLISTSDKANCLDSSDAQFVQVIHTNSALLGMSSSLGHADYFPNGGALQPGCELDITGSCSHGRSYQYFAESVRTNGFRAQECSSYFEYILDACNGTFSNMGGYEINTKVSGDFYLKTNKEAPYAIN